MSGQVSSVPGSGGQYQTAANEQRSNTADKDSPPPAVTTSNGRITLSDWVYDEEKGEWNAVNSYSFSETDRISASELQEIVDAGLGDEFMEYFYTNNMDLQRYVETAVLDNAALFYEQGYMAVQSGDKIVLAHGSVIAEQLAEILGLNSRDVVFSPTDGEGVSAGLNIAIGGKVYNSANPITDALLGSFSDDMQIMLTRLVSAGDLPAELLGADLKNGQNYTELSKLYASEYSHSPDDFDNIEIEMSSPRIKIDRAYESGSDITDVLKQYGMLGNADAWAMAIMVLSSRVQSATVQSIAANLELNKFYEDFLFNKTQALNTRLYKVIRENNAEFQRAQNARNATRTIGDRWNAMWEKFKSGNIWGGICEGLSLLYDITIGYVLNAISTAVNMVVYALLSAQVQFGSKKMSASKLEQVESWMASFKDSLDAGLKKLKVQDEGGGMQYWLTQEEADRIMEEFNSISSEEAAYLNYADINSLSDLINHNVRDSQETARGTFSGIFSVVSGVAAVLGGIAITLAATALGPLGTLLAVGLTGFLAGKVSEYADSQLAAADATAYQADASYRTAQMNRLSSQVNATIEVLGAARDNLSAEDDELGRDLGYVMEFLTNMEDVIGQLLKQISGLGQNAAQALSR